ncbi:APC family permease [Parenemella sanctibonifatiensis]|uniref:hypothetical protein n=1 Tax=Parenemella sanctibonifatiensis TaxID=2016505 RepID=UPI0039833907
MSTSDTAERTELRRTPKPHWVWAIALGSAVGWGAFILPTDWLGTAGPLGSVIGIAIGAALMCLIAVSYGMLIRTFPVSGGEYAYTYTAFGRVNAYICGWMLAQPHRVSSCPTQAGPCARPNDPAPCRPRVPPSPGALPRPPRYPPAGRTDCRQTSLPGAPPTTPSAGL